MTQDEALDAYLAAKRIESEALANKKRADEQWELARDAARLAWLVAKDTEWEVVRNKGGKDVGIQRNPLEGLA